MRGLETEARPSGLSATRRQLLERDRESDAIDELLTAATTGSGCSLLIEGPPGIGKSRLVEAAQNEARGRGVAVLAARASQLEQGIPHGVVHQLLDEAMPAATTRAGAEASSPATLERLHRIVAELAADRPLVIAIDDVQWADEETLLWLSYLKGRLESLPVLVVLAATRTAAPARSLVEALFADPRTHVLQPTQLSRAAIATLAEDALGNAAHPEFCEACRGATRGNPFLVHALLEALHAAGIAGTPADAPAVASIGPTVVARHVLRRLNGVDAPAEALLRAAALLGDGADLRVAAAIARIDLGPAATAADVLARVDVLQPRPNLHFTYPIVRAAIYSDLEGSYKIAAHKRAARLLRSDSTSVDAVAQHLLLARRAGDQWVIERLREAARRARERGAVAEAAGYLRRALDEPPAQPHMAEVLFELGSAEARTGARVGLDRLQRALELSEDPELKASIALELARELTAIADTPAARGVVERVLDDGLPGDVALRGQLEAALLRARLGELSSAPAACKTLTGIAPRVESGEAQDPALLSMLALSIVAKGEAPGRAATLAASALAASRTVVEDDPTSLATALTALTWLDEFDLASQVWSETLAEASTRGSVQLAATALCLRSHVAFRRGSVDEAEADARAALALVEDEWNRDRVAYPVAFLVDALIERGDLDEASALISALSLGGALPERWEYNLLLDSRGRLRLAQGRHHEALDDLRECGRRLAAWGVENPAVIAWRSSAATALLACDERAAAQALANSELVLAHASESRRALGIALRVAGATQGGQTGLQLLEEAVAVLDDSAAELDLAKALVDLASMLRAAGRTSAARARASRGLDTAERLGAVALAHCARDELVASGARPRRFARRGLDALTRRQREVAELAAGGASNREIADRLVVSENTVETHLRIVFRKLEISSRAQLTELLGAETPLLEELDSQ